MYIVDSHDISTMAVVNLSIREHLRRTKLPQSVDLFRFENMVDEDLDAINYDLRIT